jgi:hypothetical protein
MALIANFDQLCAVYHGLYFARIDLAAGNLQQLTTENQQHAAEPTNHRIGS